MTADNVFFQTFQTIHFSIDSSFIQHFSCFLERCGRHKAVCLQSGTSNTLKNLVSRSRNCITDFNQFQVTTFQHTILISQLTDGHDLTCLQCLRISRIRHNLLAPDTIVFIHYLQLINHLLFQEASISRIDDFNLTHHLTNDYLEMLIVNFYTLQTVYVLDFIYDIFLNSRRSHDCQDIFLYFTQFGCNSNFTVTTLDLAETNFTIDFRNDSRVRRVTSLKQFRYTRQTTSNITGFTYCTRNLDQDFTRLNHIALVFYNVCTQR